LYHVLYIEEKQVDGPGKNKKEQKEDE